MPPRSDSLSQADRLGLPLSAGPSLRTSTLAGHSEGRADAHETSRDPANVSSSFERSSRRQTFEDDSSRLGMSPPTLEDFPRGIAHSYIIDAVLYSPELPNDIPGPPSLNADIAQEEYAGEAETNRQRKRKRLASCDISAHQYSPYGHRGQVVPGFLKLDVVDINAHEGCATKDANYQANMLRRDWSIYITQTDHCDVILAHKGKVPFSLTKIVVTVPLAATHRTPSVHPRFQSTNFHISVLTSFSIHEGLVFVAMAASDFKRTVHYRRRNPQHANSSEGRGTYFRFHDRPPSRRADNPGSTPRSIGAIPPTQPSDTQWRQLGTHWVRHSHRAHQRTSSDPITPLHIFSPPIPDSEYQVRTNSNEPSSESEADKTDDESEASTTSERVTPERRTRARSDTPRPLLWNPPFIIDSDDEEVITIPPQLSTSHRTHGVYVRSPNDHGTTDPGAYVTSNSRQRRLQLYKERESNASFEQDSERGEYGQAHDILYPHASFTFEEGKTRVSVRFDPPVYAFSHSLPKVTCLPSL